MHDFPISSPLSQKLISVFIKFKSPAYPACPTSPFTPLSTFYPRRIEGYLDISSHFFTFLPISHCLALLLKIHFPLKPTCFSFLVTPGLSLHHFSPFHQRSQPTSVYPSREANPHYDIYMSLRIHWSRSFQLYIPFAQILSQTDLYGDPEGSESKRSMPCWTSINASARRVSQ